MCRESREEEGQDGRKGASFFFHLQNISGKELGEVDSMGIYVLVTQSKAEGTIMSATGINSKSSKAIFRIFRPVKKSKASNLESPGNKEGQSCSFAVALVLKEGHYARMRSLHFVSESQMRAEIVGNQRMVIGVFRCFDCSPCV